MGLVVQFIHVQRAVVCVTAKYDRIKKVFMSLKASTVCYGGASILIYKNNIS